MSQADVVLIKREVISHLFDTIKRANQYHYHAQSMQVAQGLLKEGVASPLLRDLQLSLELLDSVLNPQQDEHEIIEG